MTIPGRTTLILAAMLAALLIGAVAEPALVPAVLLADAALLAAVAASGRRLARGRVRVERVNWNRLELDCPTDLVLRIENLGRCAVGVTIQQAWPPEIEASDQTVEVQAGPGESLRVALTATARRRGRFRVPPARVDLRRTGDLARRRTRLDDGAVIKVLPRLGLVAQYDVLRRHRALQQMGVHRLRLIGSGRDFDQLREYGPDDDFRDVNWKATARRGRPITTVYQAQRSQDVMVCLECGRMMGNPVGTATALDRAIEAALVLGHVCQRSGDRMGLVLFRDTVTHFIRPARGPAASARIVEALTEVHAAGVFPSYAALVSHLRISHKRRSLIFLFTDLNDPQLASNLREVLPLISRRHVVVVVSLRDPLLEATAGGGVPHRHGLYQVLAARHLADERATRVRELIQAGVQVLEVDADSITVDVINAYLRVKMRQMV